MSLLNSLLNNLGSGLSYLGTWNASTNTPTLVSSVGSNGTYYIVSIAGSTNLNGITDWQIGDWAVFNGNVWQKIDQSDTKALWGEITGTLSNQTDLQNAFNAKVNLAGDTMTGNLSVPKISVGTTNTPSIDTVGEGLTSGPSLAGVTQTARRTTSRIGNAELNFHNNHLHSATSWIKNLFVRSKGDTDTHVSVASGDIIEESIYGGRYQSGGTGAYYPAVSIKKKIGTGTVSGTSMPGELSIEVSPDGAVVPVEAFKIASNKTATFYGAINEASEITLSSASSVAIGAAASNNIAISGTTTITSFDTVAAGIRRSVRATGAFLITNSVALITSNGKNIVTKVNDCFEMESLGSGNWVMTNFSPCDGRIMANAVNNQTGTTYQLAITDLGNDIVATQASAQTYTLPQTSTVAFPIGSKIKIINSTSSGTLTFVKQGAETLNGNTTLIAGATAFVEKTSATSWEVFGGTAIVNEVINFDFTGAILNQSYDISVRMPFSGTILGLTSKVTSLATAGNYTVAINGVNVTGLTNITNTTARTNTAATAANTFVTGDFITLTMAGTVTVVDFFGSLEYTRAY
jgi:hypothetical protein